MPELPAFPSSLEGPGYFAEDPGIKQSCPRHCWHLGCCQPLKQLPWGRPRTDSVSWRKGRDWRALWVRSPSAASKALPAGPIQALAPGESTGNPLCAIKEGVLGKQASVSGLGRGETPPFIAPKGN